MRKFLLILFATLLLTPGAQAGDNTLFSTALGAGLGGWAGSNIGRGSGRLAATASGVFLGGLVGHEVGRSMDRSNSYYARSGYSRYTSRYPIDYYQPVYTPNYVAPAAPPPGAIYASTGHGYCREYSELVRVHGQIQESYGTACLQPDGSWRVVK